MRWKNYLWRLSGRSLILKLWRKQRENGFKLLVTSVQISSLSSFRLPLASPSLLFSLTFFLNSSQRGGTCSGSLSNSTSETCALHTFAFWRYHDQGISSCIEWHGSWHVSSAQRTSAHIPSSAKSLHFPDNFDYASHSSAWKRVVVHHVKTNKSQVPGYPVAATSLCGIHLTSRDALHEVVEIVSIQKQMNWGMGAIIL